MMKKLFDVLKKIKTEYIVIAFVVLFVLYFVLAENVGYKNEVEEVFNLEEDQTVLYRQDLELRLKECLSLVKGVGRVNVSVWLDGEIYDEYVVNIEKIGSGEDYSYSETLVLVDGKPLIKNKIYPSIKSIIVYMEGSNNLLIKSSVIEVVTSVTGVDYNKIQILKIK